MEEPKKIPLDPETPQAASVEKIPMPSIYPEAMSNDVYSAKKDEGNAEQAFLNFIQKAKESKRKYNERVAKLEKENKDST